MTDNEIIKSLECCLKYETSLEAGEWCNSCPLYDDHKCLETLPLNALDLITRQKAEIEQWQGGYMTQKQEIANLEIELKAMRGAANSYKAVVERLLQELQCPQADTVQLMSEENIVHCKECRHLMFSDFEGECSKGYKGIVRPNDSCPFGVRESEESK